MTLKEFYEQIGGDYEYMIKNLPTEDCARELLKMFKKDESYSALVCAVTANNRNAAFRAAHTLKGVAGSLALSTLYTLSCDLLDLLRNPSTDIEMASISNLSREYNRVVCAIDLLE